MFHIWQLMNPRVPEEVFPADVVTPQIVTNHAHQRASANSFDQQQINASAHRKDMATRDRILRSCAHLAADRVALRRTLSFVEERWRAGADCEATFSEAENYRTNEYDKMTQDQGVLLNFEDDIRQLDPEGIRTVLVNDAPVRKKRSAPKPGR